MTDITVYSLAEAASALAEADDDTRVLDPDGKPLFLGDDGPMYQDGASAWAYGPLSEV